MTRRLSPFVLLAAGACSFFDPLDQADLHVFVLPQDTAVYVGNSYQAVGLMLNKYIDVYPSDHIAYGGLDAQATVSPAGVVTGVSFGRARVVVSRGDLRDTGWVSVVPVGTIAVSRLSDQSRVDIFDVDGSHYTSPVSSGQVNGGAPSFLPGNAGFVYQYATPGGAGATQLYVSDLTGATTRLLAAAGSDPRVARDGSWVYFEDGTNLWRIHVNGTNLERATFNADIHPDPSPDGLKLAFARHRPLPGQTFQIAVRVLATSTDTVFGPDGFYPRWSPAGDTIAYWSGDQFTRLGAIYVMAANGSGVRQVSVPGRVYRPLGLDWSPDGRWLLASADTTLDLIQVATGLTVPLAYARNYQLATWRW